MNDKFNTASEAGPTGIKKFFRISLFCAAALVLVIVFFYAEEDLRGWNTWNSYRQKLMAKGIQLDFKDFVPKTVPDDENFAATPLIKSWFASGNPSPQWSKSYSAAREKVNSIESKNGKMKNENMGGRSFVDLAAWETAFVKTRPGKPAWEQAFEHNARILDPRAKAAAAVLEDLLPDEAVVTELRDASRRTYARYPIFYNLDFPPLIMLPHLGRLKAVVQYLQIRACAELAAGQGAEALDDVKLMLYISDTLKDEPFLISYLVRLASVQISLQPVWEGLADHRWSEAQLQELQSRLEQYDFQADLKLPMNSEQASGLLIAETVRKQGFVKFQKMLGNAETLPSAMVWGGLADLAIPRGWYYLEQANFCKLSQEQIENILSFRTKSKTPERDLLNSYNRFSQILHHGWMASMLLSSLERLPIKPASAQTAVNEAALACALERCRLANGSFPETLESLAPEFIPQLPNDVVTGEPYKYNRPHKAAFVLYSVGWNKKDDHGVPGKTLFDADRGDWVWDYPEK